MFFAGVREGKMTTAAGAREAEEGPRHEQGGSLLVPSPEGLADSHQRAREDADCPPNVPEGGCSGGGCARATRTMIEAREREMKLLRLL